MKVAVITLCNIMWNQTTVIGTHIKWHKKMNTDHDFNSLFKLSFFYAQTQEN